MPPTGIFLVGSNPTTTTDKVITIVQLVYGIPSVMVMIFLLFFLGFGKSYKNSFYRLVQLDLLTNILCYLNTWLALRISSTGPAGITLLTTIQTTFPGLLDFSSMLITFFMHMQFLTATALNIHRITSVVYITSYDKYWSRWYPVVGLVCVVYSGIPVFTVNGRSYEYDVVNGSLVDYWYSDVIERSLFQTAVFSAVYFVLLLFISISTYIIVSRKIKTFTDNDRGIIKKLTKISLIYCSIYTGILFWSILETINNSIGFAPDFIFRIHSELLMFLSDLVTLALPYILLLNDRNIRRDLKGFCRTPTGVGPRVVSVT